MKFKVRYGDGSLRKRLFYVASVCLLTAVHAFGATNAGGPESLDPRLPVFIKSKEDQAHSLAKELNLTVAPELWKAFELFERGDWVAATNQFERLKSRHGQYEDSRNDRTISTPVWQTLIEVCTACEPFAFGNPKFARAFGDDIIASIPPGSIYFGGTDSGRGLVTALSKSHANADPFFTITQNALADDRYLVYLRQMYGKRIYVPSEEDSRQSFNDYLVDAQRRLKANKIKPGENVRIVDNRVQVSGQVAVMSINGLLTKIIFDHNPERDFYIEESFPLDWMYRYVVPHRLILRIERQPVAELSKEVVKEDQDFWRKYVGRLLGDWLGEKTTVPDLCDFVKKVYLRRELTGFACDPEFLADDHAQKSFSKLRSSIAGIYAWRINEAISELERQRMVQAADLAFRQAYALCPYSPEAVFRYANLLIQLDRIEDAIALVETSQKLDGRNEQINVLLKQLLELRKQRAGIAAGAKNLDEIQKQVRDNPTNFQAALNLAGAYLQSQDTNRAVRILDQVLANAGVDANAVLAVSQAYAQMGNFVGLERALEKLVQVLPQSPEAWYDLAVLRASLNKPQTAIEALGRALELGRERRRGDPKARDLPAEVRKDPRFEKIRNTPEVQQMLSPNRQ